MSDATIATFLRKGIELGLVESDLARAWADGKVECEREPSYEFIELSMSKGKDECLAVLRRVSGEVDDELVRRWLLGTVASMKLDSTEELAFAIGAAMQVARHCGLEDELHYELDDLDDWFSIARHEQEGSLARCRADLLALLRRHAQQHPPLGEA